MTKKIMALLLALTAIFSCMTTAFADAYAIDLKINEKNEISLAKDDVLTSAISLKSGSSYTFITDGKAKPEISISYGGLISSTNYTLKNEADGRIFDVVTIAVAKTDTTVTIREKDGKAAKFNLYIINSNALYSGFTSQPASAASVVYYEDIDFESASGGAKFYEGKEPDFTGAVFSFKNGSNSEVYALKDNDVKSILVGNVYSGTSITYSADQRVSLVTNSTISFKAKPNPIKSVRIVVKPEAETTYHFGKNGSIHGKLSDWYFEPDMKFDGISYKVTYKDYLKRADDTIPVEKDAKGYYISIPGFDKQYITYDAHVKDNKTADFNALVYVGGASYQHTIKIEKANFFEMIKIYFGLLFGKYK